MADESFSSLDGDRRKELDCEQVGPDGEEVQRQRVQIAGDTPPKKVQVTNTVPLASDYALVVRLAGSSGTTTGTVDQGLPNTLANGWPVKMTDGLTVLGTVTDPVRVEEFSSLGANTVVPSSVTPVTLLVANVARRGTSITNNSIRRLFILLAAGVVSSSNYTKRMEPDEYFEVPFGYTGIITGLWAAPAAGDAQVTEYT